LIDLLTKIRSQGAKPLLDQTDIETMFSMFDITQKGVLTKQQAYRAIKTVLGPEHDVVKSSIIDCADATTLLTKGQFVAYVTGALSQSMPHTTVE
jgi:hypothetical protein